MQSVELFDELRITLQPSTIDVCCDHPSLSNPQENLVFKAARALKDHSATDAGAIIELKKNIPVAAGLAGGSSDAAAALTGLNILWGLNLSLNELQKVGALIGSDIPFCLEGGTLLAEGRGERLSKVSRFPEAVVIIATPGFQLSTREIYDEWDRAHVDVRPGMSGLLKALNGGDLRRACSSLANVLEEVVFEEYPGVKEIKEKCLEAGALGALMSGSGPSVFSIAETRREAAKISEALEGLCSSVVLTTPSATGVEVVAKPG